MVEPNVIAPLLPITRAVTVPAPISPPTPATGTPFPTFAAGTVKLMRSTVALFARLVPVPIRTYSVFGTVMEKSSLPVVDKAPAPV